MKREELRDYVDRQRSLDNIPYDVYSTLIDGIDTLEQDPVLEKIKAEIDLETRVQVKHYTNTDAIIDAVLDVVDNYKADKEYEVEVITHGKCMMCGKELNEGLFFCKECEAKAESEE